MEHVPDQIASDHLASEQSPRRTPTGDDVMNLGAPAVLKVTKPAAAKTYRVWLVK